MINAIILDKSEISSKKPMSLSDLTSDDMPLSFDAMARAEMIIVIDNDSNQIEVVKNRYGKRGTWKFCAS